MATSSGVLSSAASKIYGGAAGAVTAVTGSKSDDDQLRVEVHYPEGSGDSIREGSPRPFVYVPKGLERGVRLSKCWRRWASMSSGAPSMVLRVSKATMPPVHETAAVRQAL